MKKLIVIGLGLLSVSQMAVATEARVYTLGGETAMLMDDDTNIDLFPQTINKWSLFRVANIHQANGRDDAGNDGEYAVLIGDPGDKWGLYGGQNNSNEFLSVYRSLGVDKAVKFGFNFNTDKIETSDTTTPGTSSETKINRLGFNATYGMNQGTTELAYTFAYAKNPVANDIYPGMCDLPMTVVAGGCAEQTNTTGTVTDSEARKDNIILLGADMRRPQNIAIFNTLYANVFLLSRKDNYSENTGTANQEVKSTGIGGNALIFNKKSFNNTDSLYYGVGLGLTYVKAKTSASPNASGDSKTTTIGGPRIRLGLEKDIKYGALRFGVNRDIDFISSSQADSSGGGTTERFKDSGIGKNDSYSIITGWGMDYKNLKIDIVLNRLFWNSGPQMVFDGNNGTLGTQADIVYTF